MIFIIGLGLSLIILCSIIYLHPLFSIKLNGIILLGLATISFILSSVMGMLYSIFVGILIFLLLIGSMALLIGKRQEWIEFTGKKNLATSRRSRHKEVNVSDVSVLQTISSTGDQLLYQKTIDVLESIQPTELQNEVIHAALNSHALEQIPYLEVSATSESIFQHSNQQTDYSLQDDILTYDTIQDKPKLPPKVKQKESEVLEELSDQWMENRVSSLFEKVEQKTLVEADTKESITGLEKKSFRYEDLSESYFKDVRSEENGKT